MTTLRNEHTLPFVELTADHLARVSGGEKKPPTTLTGAITNFSSKTGTAKYRAYEQIDAAPEDRARGIQIQPPRLPGTLFLLPGQIEELQRIQGKPPVTRT
jgi:hypothetical protein